MKEEKKETKSFKGSTAGKIKKLHKQYNKILVDLFDQFAAESIEEALEKNEGSFGENIDGIVQCALDCLKTKVLDELGVSGGDGEVSIAVGGIDIEPFSDEGPAVKGFEIESQPSDDDSDEDDSEDEKEEDDDSDDEKINEESIKKDKLLSKLRRGDQHLIAETYTQMYTK